MTTKNDTSKLLEELAADSAPVRPLWSPGLRLLSWAGVQLVFAAYVVAGGTRPDLTAQLASPTYVAELLILIVATLLMARAAVAAAIPGDERWNLGRLGVSAAVLATLFVLTRSPDTNQAIAGFIGAGFPCALHTTLLSLLPTAWLLVAVFRGFTLSPGRAGALAGGCGFVFGFTLMRVLCPADEPLHLVAWHWLPVSLGAGAAAAGGALLLGHEK